MDLSDHGLPEIRDLADEYARNHGWEEIETLAANDRDHKAFKAEAWARKAVAEDDLPARLDYLRELARDENWRVREAAAMALKYVNEHAFEQVEPAWEEWVTHEDNYVRRACEVGLMRTPPEHVDSALDLFDHLVADSDDYVKKSCGAFALSNVAATDPAVGRAYLDRWSRSDDLRTRWNVAKAIGGGYGRATDHAVDLAYRLSGDDEYRVRRATASSLKKRFDEDPDLRDRVEGWDDREEFRSML
ncbi:DNA alkylation repair enzyme [Halomicrobium zhouii]|uniref:DNA alkylation repair enzyme n=1 Tax=Halomicrobium zhouii TaxID=767519 RepID=A0A1I6KKV5_9EURY|nr:HEAT repeat domain-containing protein [Halomicrobium zhouii]SFR91841.1 DNA alkylation repair enzyme [Halomicrobium zhouii]